MSFCDHDDKTHVQEDDEMKWLKKRPCFPDAMIKSGWLSLDFL